MFVRILYIIAEAQIYFTRVFINEGHPETVIVDVFIVKIQYMEELIEADR